MTRLCLLSALLFGLLPHPYAASDAVTDEALALQKRRVELIAKITPAVCAIFRGRGGGSGVIIHPDGWVLSNYHVTSFSKQLRVGLPDHKVYKATVVGLDPTGDIALLKLHGKKRWPYAPLGDSDDLKLGEWVIAAGNPFLLATDFTPTVTMGIVSGTHRFLSGAGGFKLTYPDAVATDAPINPGNSGGPLFNMAGEVVGINGRISLRDRGRVNIGAGYAISANAIKNLLGTLHAGEIVERANMNATVRNEEGKVIFDQMFEDSAAYKAGLRLGDELVEFDGMPIGTANQFMNRIWTLISGWKVKVVVRRNDKLSTHWVTLTAIPMRGKKRKGDWKPLGAEWRKKRASELAADWTAYRGARKKRKAEGKARSAGYQASYQGFEPTSVKGKDGILLFLTAAVKRNGTELAADEARRMQLAWSLAPTPTELLGEGHLALGELHSSGRVGRTASILVVYPGPDDERLHFHYDVARRRLLGLDRYVGERLDLRISYQAYRKLGSSKLPTRRVISRPAGKPWTISLHSVQLEGLVKDRKVNPAPIASDAPLPRPGSSLQPALEKVTPALVKIYGAGRVKGIASYGTGVLVSADGRILTYNSAMLATPNLYVVTHDGRHMPAKVVHRDYDRDVAIIDIPGTKHPFLEPYEGKTTPGMWVVAIGNAFNLAQGAEPLTVNLGVLSARTRLLARRNLADFPYQGDVYVVDAQINPGSYGGPLLDLRGRWIGLSGKVLASKETNTLFHYALPVTAIDDLIAGKPRKKTAARRTGARVFTGLIFLDAGPFSSPPPYVDRIFPASPASRAGFKKDDLIIRVADRRVKSIDEFRKALRGYSPGETVTLSVKRGKLVKRIKLTLEEDEDEDEDLPPKKRKKPTTLKGWLNEFTLQLREAASPMAKRSAALKLASLGKPAAPILAGLLRVKDQEVRQAALSGLRKLGPDAGGAVGKLREILDNGRAEELRREVVVTLAAIGPPALPAADRLVALLGAPDVLLRQAAFAALVQIGPKGVPHLLSGLGTPAGPAVELVLEQLGKAALPAVEAALAVAQSRQNAVRALGALGPAGRPALPRLLPLLQSKDRNLRQEAIGAIGRMRDAGATDPLLALLDSERADVLAAFEQMGTAAERAVPRLTALLGATSKAPEAVRLLRCLTAIGKPAAPILAAVDKLIAAEKLIWLPEVPRALASLGEASLPTVERLLASKDVARQRVGLATVGLLEGKAVSMLDKVLPHTRSPQPDLRRLSLECIGLLGKRSPAVSKALVAGLTDRRPAVNWSAAWAAGQIKDSSPAVRKRLIRLCGSFNETTQEAALRGLVKTGGPADELAPVFVRALTHFKPQVRESAAQGLGGLEKAKPATIKALIEALRDEDWEVKRAAVAALARIGQPAVLKLTLTLADQDPAMRYLAAHALVQIGPKAVRAAPGLIKLLEDRRAEVRERAAAALGAIGKPAAAARGALIKLLEDPMLDVAEAAAAALRKVTGKNYDHPSEWTEDRPFRRPDVKEEK